MRLRNHSILVLPLFLILVSSCIKDKYDHVETNYPTDVENIITTRCAITGCHVTNSKDAAAGLDLSSWDKMFNGTNVGSAVIPYSSKFSPLLYFVNTDSLDGLVNRPTMPLNSAPLTTNQYHLLRDWIEAGAPDKSGFVKFSDNPNRKKIYISNQGCDNVSVLDAEKKVIIRYFEVGTIPEANPPETPHSIKVTPDNKWLIVIFSGANQGYMQVYDTKTDLLVKNISIGIGGWNTMAISSDSKYVYAADFNNGNVVFVDLDAGITTKTFNLGSGLHGVGLNKTDDTLYIAQNLSSGLFKIPINDISNFENFDLNAVQPAPGNLKPHEINFSPDWSNYFITCEGTSANQVRVYNAHNDQLIKVINVGIKPVEMSFSEKRKLLFVTCMEDHFFPFTTGSVRVIDLNTLNEINQIEVGWQPHDLEVDDVEGLVYVANRNYGGPAPHHAAACGGQNGYLVAIDMNTMKLSPKVKAELSVDPYSITIKN